MAALREAVTLRHLHGGGVDCASGLDDRLPWRRWSHHATLGGFALCFASTTVAAIYHSVFEWTAPHGYLSAAGRARVRSAASAWWPGRWDC